MRNIRAVDAGIAAVTPDIAAPDQLQFRGCSRPPALHPKHLARRPFGPTPKVVNDCTEFVSFAVVTGLGAGNITSFSSPPQALPSSTGTHYSTLALGPNGEVAASFVVQTNSTNSSIYLTVNTNGIYNPQWAAPIDVVDSNLPKRHPITPDPSGIGQFGRLTFDLRGKYPHRLYVVYTDCATNNTNNTFIQFKYSTDYGSSWSSVTTLNNDTNNLAHCLPALAADP